LAQFGTEGNPSEDLIPLDEAERLADVSRRTIYRLIEAGQLSKYKRPGDRKTYLSRAQILANTGFREVRAAYDETSR